MYTLVQNGNYLYAASSSANSLKSKAEADANAYWEISEADGTWSIVASRSANRNVLQYNASVFSCYSSASHTAVKLHPVSNIAPIPAITADASIALTSVAVASAQSTGATFNSNTSSVTAGAYSDVECTVASTWLTVSTSGSGSSTVVNYTATANDTGAERTGYIKITATNSSSRSVSKVIAVTQAAAGVLKKYTLTFSAGTNQTKVSSYTSSWNAVCGGFTWTLTNFNNNNTGPGGSGTWTVATCGRKGNASIATITTSTVISEAIGTVTVTVDAVAAAKVNSFKLYVASDSGFSSDLQTITKTIATGDVKFTVPSPAENRYYKVEVDCASHDSSNGFVTISKVVYQESGGSGGGADYSTTYTTSGSVELAVSGGSTTSKVNISSTNYDAVKANKGATFTITIPANTTTVHLFIAAWNGEAQTVTVTGGTMSDTRISADTGISGSGTTYTLAGTISDYYRTITPSSSSTTSITIATESGKREACCDLGS